jgi:hypothetical protein
LGAEIDDRVADELTGSVVRDLPSAIGVDDVDTSRAQRVRVPQHVVVCSAATDRVDVRMLEEQQRVVDLAGHTSFVQLRLKREGVRVCDPAELFDR